MIRVKERRGAITKGIESVRRNAVVAKLEDQTVEGFQVLTNPKFEVYTDKAGEYRFRLTARNGEIIATSEGYKAKASCMNGLEVELYSGLYCFDREFTHDDDLLQNLSDTAEISISAATGGCQRTGRSGR